MGYLYVYMKLIDIIFEDENSSLGEGYNVVTKDDFLNKDQMLNYEKAKYKIKKYKFKSGREFFEFYKKNSGIKNIPRTPNQYYTIKKEWKSWPDFLGTSTKPGSRKS